MVESRRSSAAAKSKRVFTHNQRSLAPVPTVRPDSFASREYLSFSRSVSSRVGVRRLALVFTTGVVATVALALAFAFALAFLLFWFPWLSQPAINTKSA